MQYGVNIANMTYMTQDNIQMLLWRFIIVPLEHQHMLSNGKRVLLILSLQVYCKTMCDGPEDPSQWATESTIQCHPGEGFHCNNQGGARVSVLISDVLPLTCCVFVLAASGWEEVGGSVKAARLGCEDHTTLVQATPQPGKAEYSRSVLWKHVRQIMQDTLFNW